MIRLLTLEKNVTTHEKIDDDDGHYIVTEDMLIGDRCECLRQEGIHHPERVLTVRRPSQQAFGPRHLWQSRRSL